MQCRSGLLTFVLLVHMGCVGARVTDAPLMVANEHPAQRTVLRPKPGAARSLGSGAMRARAQVAWTSHWLRDGPDRDFIIQDGETLWLDIELARGLGAGFELSAGISFGHASGGVLDEFIEAWHEAFGLPQSQRDLLPRSEFHMLVQDLSESGDPKDVYRLEEEALLFGDLPVMLDWQLPLPAEDLQVALRAGIEVPTGSESHGSGNGGFDYVLGLEASLEASSWLQLHAWGSHSWVANSDAMEAAGAELANVLMAGGALSLRLSESLVAIAQVDWEQSTLRELEEIRASRDHLVLWLGGRAALSERLGLEFSVAEDLVLEVSPDVQFHLGFVIE
jgi:hypothetical protein